MTGEPPAGTWTPLHYFNNQTTSNFVQIQNENYIEKILGKIIVGDRNLRIEASMIEWQDTVALIKIIEVGDSEETLFAENNSQDRKNSILPPEKILRFQPINKKRIIKLHHRYQEIKTINK